MQNYILLIKGYLKAVGMVSKNYYIDREFKRFDYRLIMLIDQIGCHYQKQFLKQDEH